MSKNILVTGGAGFIGTNLIKLLLSQDNKVICVDNLYTGQESNLNLFKDNPNFSFFHHDIINPLNLTGLDQIYNLACPASPPAYLVAPILTWKTSTIGVLNLLELSRLNGNIPILQTSTSEVYGDPLVNPQPETYRGNVNTFGPRACYDESKRAAETIMYEYHHNYQTPIRIIRIFNTYGPYMDPNDGRVVSNFINQAISNKDITIYGDGSQTRSFQYVDDLVSGMTLMMNNDKDFTGPVNIGNPDEFTVKEFAQLVLTMIPESTSKITYKDLPTDDPKVRKPDITLAKSMLNWCPKIKLKEGLQKTIQYFKQLKTAHELQSTNQ